MDVVMMFTGQTAVSEVARFILAEQLAVMAQHWPLLLAEAELTAVHETRKAMRRTFTGFKLFRPFFELEVFTPYRLELRGMMVYLGQARDTAVFQQKLQAYIAASGQDLGCLVAYWQGRQAAVDAALCAYVAQPERQLFWQDYGRFTQTPSLYAQSQPDATPAAHHIPILIYQRLAKLQAYAYELDTASLVHLHQLRIYGKELRYALHFFAPLLGPEIGLVQASLEQMQEHLGALQDAHIGLGLLAETEGCGATAVATYHAAIEDEINRLLAQFPAIWAEVNSRTWRQNLAAALAVL